MTQQNLRIKIQLVEPPVNFAVCLQRGKGAKAERLDYVEVLKNNGQTVEFELEVTVRKAKNGPEPDYFGPFAQGPISARFFYLCIGSVVEAGDPMWSGRVKVPLAGLDWSTIDAATTPGHFLFARYQASKPDGKPVYATVKLLDDGWTIRSDRDMSFISAKR
ncbi:MAG: DUF5990 family protein [Gammaproteobacteria bacterium]|nr:DUF5990 family protein [Gammaproteobacteria bacterium]